MGARVDCSCAVYDDTRSRIILCWAGTQGKCIVGFNVVSGFDRFDVDHLGGLCYTLAFGTSESEALNRYIGDWEAIMMTGVDSSSVYVTSAEGEPASGIPTILFAAFQMTFAIITPALMVGAFVERMKFSAVLFFSGIWLVVVYVPIFHMTWGRGAYSDMGVIDFAGGSLFI